MSSSAVPPSSGAAPSAAEQTTSARVGAVLFRNRSWLPVPFVLVALLAPGHATAINWIVGAILICIGEWIRLAGVAAAGTVTRRRSRNVQRLVTYGIFRWVHVTTTYDGNSRAAESGTQSSSIEAHQPAGPEQMFCVART